MGNTDCRFARCSAVAGSIVGDIPESRQKMGAVARSLICPHGLETSQICLAFGACAREEVA